MRTITGTIIGIDGIVVANTAVTFTLVNTRGLPTSTFDAVTYDRVYGSKTVTTDTLGAFSVSLWENTKLVDDTCYLVEVAIANDIPFMASVSEGIAALDWLEFKVAGQIVTPAQLLIIEAFINRAELAASGAEASVLSLTTIVGDINAALNAINGEII